MSLIIMSFNFSSKIHMSSFVESCLLRLILDSADSAMGVDKGGQEADTVRGSMEKRENFFSFQKLQDLARN